MGLIADLIGDLIDGLFNGQRRRARAFARVKRLGRPSPRAALNRRDNESARIEGGDVFGSLFS
jgi:hypothetical protein